MTKVCGRKEGRRERETETKIALDLGILYELLNEALCGKRFRLSVRLSVCLWPGISRTVAIKFRITVSQ
jgi:hypothetical protein